MPPSGTPRELLSTTRDLTRRVRDAQRGAWFPLLLFGLVSLAAAPVDRFGHHAATCGPVHDGARLCTRYSPWSFVYWPIALFLAYAAITGFYVHRARSRGVGTRVQPYVIAGIILAALLTGVSLWAAHHPPGAEHDILGLHLQAQSSVTAFFYRLASPASAIGLALLALAWIERDVMLLVFALVYLIIVLVPVDFGWVIIRPSPWGFLPHLIITAGVLLLGGAAFALARRPTS